MRVAMREGNSEERDRYHPPTRTRSVSGHSASHFRTDHEPNFRAIRNVFHLPVDVGQKSIMLANADDDAIVHV